MSDQKELSNYLRQFNAHAARVRPWISTDDQPRSVMPVTNAMFNAQEQHMQYKILERILNGEEINEVDAVMILPLLQKLQSQQPTEPLTEVVDIPKEFLISHDQLIHMPFFDLGVFKFKLDMWSAYINGGSTSDYFYDIKNRPENEKKEFDLHVQATTKMDWVETVEPSCTDECWILRLRFKPYNEPPDVSKTQSVIDALRILYITYYEKIMENPHGPREGVQFSMCCSEFVWDNYIQPLGFKCYREKGSTILTVFI